MAGAYVQSNGIVGAHRVWLASALCLKSSPLPNPCIHARHGTTPIPHLLLTLPAADNGAVMYSALKETPFAEHMRLVPMTGEGLAVSPTNRLLWQPLTRMRLEAWEEFSVRLRDDDVSDR